MSAQRNVAKTFPFFVEHSQCPTTVAHINSIVRGVVADIIGVPASPNRLDLLKGSGIPVADSAISSISYNESVRHWQVAYALWFIKSTQALYPRPLLEVDYFHRIIAQSGDKQALTFHIHIQVINA